MSAACACVEGPDACNARLALRSWLAVHNVSSTAVITSGAGSSLSCHLAKVGSRGLLKIEMATFDKRDVSKTLAMEKALAK